MKYIIISTSGIKELEVTSAPCNGDSSYVTYHFTCGNLTGGGVVKGEKEVKKELVKWAKRIFIGYQSITLSV